MLGSHAFQICYCLWLNLCFFFKLEWMCVCLSNISHIALGTIHLATFCGQSNVRMRKWYMQLWSHGPEYDRGKALQKQLKRAKTAESTKSNNKVATHSVCMFFLYVHMIRARTLIVFFLRIPTSIHNQWICTCVLNGVCLYCVCVKTQTHTH